MIEDPVYILGGNVLCQILKKPPNLFRHLCGINEIRLVIWTFPGINCGLLLSQLFITDLKDQLKQLFIAAVFGQGKQPFGGNRYQHIKPWGQNNILPPLSHGHDGFSLTDFNRMPATPGAGTKLLRYHLDPVSRNNPFILPHPVLQNQVAELGQVQSTQFKTYKRVQETVLFFYLRQGGDTQWSKEILVGKLENTF